MPIPKRFAVQEAIAGLRAEQARIQAATEHMESLCGSAMSKDRMITVTVDSRGRLTELRLVGTRYRQLAPKELCTRIVTTVREAQENAACEAASALTDLLPPGLGMPVDADFDLDTMFDEAISAAVATAPDADQTSQEGTDSDG